MALVETNALVWAMMSSEVKGQEEQLDLQSLIGNRTLDHDTEANILVKISGIP